MAYRYRKASLKRWPAYEFTYRFERFLEEAVRAGMTTKVLVAELMRAVLRLNERT